MMIVFQAEMNILSCFTQAKTELADSNVQRVKDMEPRNQYIYFH